MRKKAAAGRVEFGHKTILMVDYHFPPVGGSGVRRTLGWARCLREYGWAPLILTVRDGDAPFQDPFLCNYVPNDVSIYRAPSVEPVRFLRNVLRRKSSPTAGVSGAIQTHYLDWLRHFGPWILFPDRHIGWLLPAVAAGISIIRSRRIDIICSTYSDTVSAHLVAYVLKTISGKPWVADFQDPWAETYITDFPTALHRIMAERVERAILSKADHIIVTTNTIKDTYARRFAPKDHSGVTVIPVGFDPEAFENQDPVSDVSSFGIVHFGVFWGARSPVPFLEGLAQAIKIDSELAQSVEVKFLGGFDPKYLKATLQLVARYGLENKIRLMGFVSYRDGIRTLLGSAISLLILANTEVGKRLVPCKLYDYLAARKPVLALVPDGESARIIRETKAGVVVDPDDREKIANAIGRFYRQWRENRLQSADSRCAERFSYRETTKSLAFVLNQVQATTQTLQP